jgi:hypothetical protein
METKAEQTESRESPVAVAASDRNRAAILNRRGALKGGVRDTTRAGCQVQALTGPLRRPGVGDGGAGGTQIGLGVAAP